MDHDEFGGQYRSEIDKILEDSFFYGKSVILVWFIWFFEKLSVEPIFKILSFLTIEEKRCDTDSFWTIIQISFDNLFCRKNWAEDEFTLIDSSLVHSKWINILIFYSFEIWIFVCQLKRKWFFVRSTVKCPFFSIRRKEKELKFIKMKKKKKNVERMKSEFYWEIWRFWMKFTWIGRYVKKRHEKKLRWFKSKMKQMHNAN